MTSRARTLLALPLFTAMAVALAAPKTAEAEGGKSRVDIMLALSTNEGTTVDPRLAHLASDFKQKHLAFSSFSVVQQKIFELDEGKSNTMDLPNGKRFELVLVKKEASGKLHMRLNLPGVWGSAEYDVGPGGELILDGGPHGKGELWFLVRH